MSDDMVSADEFRKTVALVADKMQKFIDERDAEIKRLRAAGDALAEDSWNNRSADEAVKAWWEARNA